MKKFIFILLLISICFAGYIYEGKELKELTDEGFIIYDVLDVDSNVVYTNAFATPEELGLDSLKLRILFYEEYQDSALVDSILNSVTGSTGNSTSWIAGVLMILLGGGSYLAIKKQR